MKASETVLLAVIILVVIALAWWAAKRYLPKKSGFETGPCDTEAAVAYPSPAAGPYALREADLAQRRDAMYGPFAEPRTVQPPDTSPQTAARIQSEEEMRRGVPEEHQELEPCAVHEGESDGRFEDYVRRSVIDPEILKNHREWVAEVRPFSGGAIMPDRYEYDAHINALDRRGFLHWMRNWGKATAPVQYNPMQLTEVDDVDLATEPKFDMEG